MTDRAVRGQCQDNTTLMQSVATKSRSDLRMK